MTKLFLPRPARYLVDRARLVEKLNRCLEPEIRLALVSAPAGFGKTTLVSTWAAQTALLEPAPCLAWLSLDDGDNDPVIFWSYVIAAFQQQQPGIGQAALNLLAAHGVAIEACLAALINDVQGITRPCVLVLDDYHLIRSPQIHRTLAYFLEHLPPHACLLVASRTDPPLPLALLRGRGQLLQFRMNDLRFSVDDAARYFNNGLGLNLDDHSVGQLTHKTEGWVAGLQMAALALQDLSPREGAFPAVQDSAPGFVSSFSGSNRYILDYLIEEVLARQPEQVQTFLIRSSLLDQLCGPLCDALLDDTGPTGGSQSMLEYLESANLFLIPLDQQRCWYRYHHLFADLLRKRLLQAGPDLVRELHSRAAGWYERNSLIPGAVHHAFQIPDYPWAASLVRQVAEEMWGRGEHAALLGWIDNLPEAERQRHPSLLTFQVSMLISSGRMKEAEGCIPILERYIAETLDSSQPVEMTPDRSALLGRIAALRTYIASFYHDHQSLFANAREALAHLTRPEDMGQRCIVSMVLGHACLVEGELEAASQALLESIDAGKQAGKPYMVLSSMANLARLLWLQGSLRRAEEVLDAAVPIIEACGGQRSASAVEIALTRAELLREQGLLDEAADMIEQAFPLAQELRYIWPAAWGLQTQARLHLDQGNMPAAEASAEAAVQWASAHTVPEYIACEAAGLFARILLRREKIEQAERFLRERQLAASIRFPHLPEHLSSCRLKWLQGDPDGALSELNRLAQAAQETQQHAAQIAARVLQAAICQAAGRVQQGVLYLDQALGLAESGGYVRVFVEEGELAAALLREAAKQNLHREVCERLLLSFPIHPYSGAGEAAPAGDSVHSGPRSEPSHALADPLSPREMETLRLIAEGLSNKEIAQKMYISLRTVKYYSTGIYNKLGVDSRMQAVVRARELGLL